MLLWLAWKIVGRVKVYLRTSELVSLQDTERRRINMYSDEVLTTDVGITKLMDVGYLGARDRPLRTFATGVVTQATLFVVREDRFPHEALMNADYSMRTVVIVNRRFVAWAPANHQHLDCLIAENPVTPVIAFLESDVRLEIRIDDLDT